MRNRQIGILTICLFLVSCSSYNQKLKDSSVSGRYQTIYQKQQNLSADSVAIQIKIYSLETGIPLDFQGSKFSLADYPNIIIQGNTFRAHFHKNDVPSRIFIESYRYKKFPLKIFPVLKKKKSILYKAYLADDSRGKI